MSSALPQPGQEATQATAQLFEDGENQAVRLPDGFRFEGEEVTISRVQDGILLQPLVSNATQTCEDLDAFWAKLDRYNRELGPFMPEGRNQPPMPPREDLF